MVVVRITRPKFLPNAALLFGLLGFVSTFLSLTLRGAIR